MVTIRRGTREDDLEAISEVINRAYKKQPFFYEASRRLKPGELHQLLTLPENELYIALSGEGKVCGTLLITWGEERSAEFSLLAVAPPFQGREIGGRLLKVAEERVVELGGERVYLKVIPMRQEKLVAYYATKGYVKSEKKVPFPEKEKGTYVLPEFREEIYFAILEKDLTSTHSSHTGSTRGPRRCL